MNPRQEITLSPRMPTFLIFENKPTGKKFDTLKAGQHVQGWMVKTIPGIRFYFQHVYKVEGKHSNRVILPGNNYKYTITKAHGRPQTLEPKQRDGTTFTAFPVHIKKLSD